MSARRTRSGIAFGLGAYLWWGAIPIYFKALAYVQASAVVAHRIIWSLVFLALLMSLWRRWTAFASALARPRVLAMLAITALLISCNWLTYIWAVTSGNVVAASLGYYLNPLVNVLLGVVLLKERLSRLQMVAVFLAGAGVALLAASALGTLWISLTLAVSFSLYGLLRKITPVESLEGLSVETLLLAPIAIVWLLWLDSQGSPSLGIDWRTDLLLVLAGIVTAVPLLLFNAAARRIAYSTLGFLQYVSPSIQLVLAVLLFGESLTPAHVACFALIWTALLLFAADGLRAGRAAASGRASEMAQNRGTTGLTDG